MTDTDPTCPGPQNVEGRGRATLSSAVGGSGDTAESWGLGFLLTGSAQCDYDKHPVLRDHSHMVWD